MCAAGNGECGGNTVRASVRCAQARNARNISTKIDGGALSDRHTHGRHLRFIKAYNDLTRRTAGGCVRRRNLRLWPNPTNLRLRRQFSPPKISSVAEHRDPERVHFRRHFGVPPAADMGGDVQAGDGSDRRVAGSKSVVVDNRGSPVLVRSGEPKV